jgi:hypothetical protein
MPAMKVPPSNAAIAAEHTLMMQHQIEIALLQ